MVTAAEVLDLQRPAPGGRRAEIVRAAARLFSDRGYHGTSMQHLAEALGLRRGSLYSHIGSKEELLFDVVDDGADRFLERAEAAAAAPGSAAERLRRLLVGHIETVSEHLDGATVFLNEWRYLSEPLRTRIQEKRDRYEGLVRDLVRQGASEGDFRSGVDQDFAALLVLSAGNWTYTWYRPGGSLAPAEVGERFADLILEGLRSTEEAS